MTNNFEIIKEKMSNIMLDKVISELLEAKILIPTKEYREDNKRIFRDNEKVNAFVKTIIEKVLFLNGGHEWMFDDFSDAQIDELIKKFTEDSMPKFVNILKDVIILNN